MFVPNTSSYVDLRSVSLEIKEMDLNYVSERLDAPKILEKETTDYKFPVPAVTVYSVDHLVKSVWVHLGITGIACDILGVEHPDHKMITYLRIAQESASRRGTGFSVEEMSSALKTIKTFELIASPRIKILKSVLGLEYHLAHVASVSEHSL